MTGTHLPSRTTTVYLDSYATGNPFVVSAATSIVTTQGDAIYGSAAQTWTLVNAGTVVSASDVGVALAGGGRVSNKAGGTIASTLGNALEIWGAPGSVTNAGTISGYGQGVRLLAGGRVGNVAGGTITTSLYYYGPAVFVEGGRASVTNAGRIAGGVLLVGPGYGYGDGYGVANAAGGVIESQSGDGVQITYGEGSVTNAGLIYGGFDGVALLYGGSVINAAGGEIASTLGGNGVDVGEGTVTNAGSIQGGLTGVTLFEGALINTGAISGQYYGVLLVHGSITNSGAAALISGDVGVQIAGSAGAVVNSGTISGVKLAVVMTAGGSVDNAAGGLIASTYDNAVEISGGLGSVTNAGTILGGDVAVDLFGGGGVVNVAGGLIASYGDGVEIDGGAGSVTNAGAISAGYVGVFLHGGGRIANQRAGTILGGRYGVEVISAAGTVINDGIITTTSLIAVELLMGGTIANHASGVIEGDVLTGGAAAVVTNAGTIEAARPGEIGVVLGGAFDNSLTNSGTITGYHHGSAVQFGAGNDRLTLDPGAVFDGGVDGGAGANTLELAAGKAAGVFSGLGSQFTHFRTVSVDAGATWTISGPNTVAAGGLLTDAGILTIDGPLANAGVIAVTGAGTLTMNGAVTGAGAAQIAGGTLDAAGAFDQNVAFTGTAGLLELARGYAGVVSGFSTGAVFDLVDIDFKTAEASYSGTTSKGLLTVTDGTHTDNIAMSGDYTTSKFILGRDGHGGTTVVEQPTAVSTMEPANALALGNPQAHAFIALAAGLGAGVGATGSPIAHPWRETPPTLLAPRLQLA